MEIYKMITDAKFAEAIKKIDILEKNGSFYKRAVNLINKGFEVDAYLFILATWNFARFRYVVKDFDINNFKQTIENLSYNFDKLKDRNSRTINFDEFKEDIKKIFESLSLIKGIEYTGASKIMHLKNREVFIMWDGYIKGDKPRRYYNALDIVKDKDWEFKKYNNTPEDYFQFLKDMQERFKNIRFQSNEKTFAKAIDEFNYVNITLPIQEMERNNKKLKKTNKKNEEKVK